MLKNWLVSGMMGMMGLGVQAQVIFYGEPEGVALANTPQSELYLQVSNYGKLVLTRELFAGNKGGINDPGDLWFETGITMSNRILPINEPDLFSSPIGYTPDGRYFLFLEANQKRAWETQLSGFDLTGSVKMEVVVPELRNSSPRPSGCISANGAFLVLSLERPNGYGVEDLYVVRKKPNGEWDSPQNLGFTINSALQEITPFLAQDNRTLFFATNARSGFGGFDLYKTTRLDDSWRNWSEPENLGPQVNSEGAEMSLAFQANAEYAYFISTQNSDGYGDVKRISIRATLAADTLATPISTSSLEISYLRTLLLSAKSGLPLSGEAIVDELVIRGDGNGALLIADTLKGEVEFKAEGHLSEVLDLATLQTDSVTEIILEPLETGNVIVLKQVLFYKGTANLVEGSERELDLVVEMLVEHPDIRIFLKGHTDNVGDPRLNVQLSNERVQMVREYLIEKGIEPARMEGKGFGGSQPIAENISEATRQLNRRVEFEIIRD